MAQYNVDHSCGHSHTHNLVGKHKQREWRLERLAHESCPACQEIERQAEHERQNRVAAAASAALELPPLTGSEKQVAWATTIRVQFLDKLREEGRDLLRGETEIREKTGENGVSLLKQAAQSVEARAVLADFLEEKGIGYEEFWWRLRLALPLRDKCLAQTDSRWWIDNRNLSIEYLSRLFPEFLPREEKEELAAAKRRAEEIRAAEVADKKAKDEAAAANLEKFHARLAALRERLKAIHPEILLANPWEKNGDRRVYVDRSGKGKTAVVFHVTGNRYNQPESFEGLNLLGEVDREGFAALLKEISAFGQRIHVEE